MRYAIQLVVLVVLAVLGVSCDEPEVPLAPKSQTFAELRVVRRAVSVTPAGDEGARAPYPRERLTDGTVVEVEPNGLAWLRRDGGATMLVQGPAKLRLRPTVIEVDKGRIFVDTPTGTLAEVATPQGMLVLAGVRSSVEVGADTSEVYVLRGEVRTASAARARSGERMRLAGKGESVDVSVTPALAWEDWTGGLATTDAAAQPSPFGVGTVGARTPGQQGAPHFPLAIQRLQVRVSITRDFAVTEVDQTFFNPSSAVVEGVYRFRAPPGATLHKFGVDRAGSVIWGYVKEKKAAAAQYQQHVYQGSTEDPALLEWEAPGVYRARLYPIGPGQTRQVVVRYAEWLGRTGEKGNRRLYVYPMAAEGAEGSLPVVEEFAADINLADAGAKDVRAGIDAVRTGDILQIRGHDMIPRANLAVELFDDGVDELTAYRAPHTVNIDSLPSSEHAEAKRLAQGEGDYVLVPIRATDVPAVEPGLDLAIVVDTSAATDRASLSIARAATRALLAHLSDRDRALVFAGDDRLRPVLPERTTLSKLDDADKREISTRLSHVRIGGASDLGSMLSEAAATLDPERRGALVYIGDGRPTVGELALTELRDRMAKLPRPVRVFALGVGDAADMQILEGLSRGAFAERVGDGYEATTAALRLLEEAERPVWLEAKVDLGADVERIHPRDLSTLVADESLLVVGRIATDKKSPASITVAGTAGKTERKVTAVALEDRGDLRRRWAEGRLAQMLEEDAGRAAMVDLGSRQGIITPVTSLYVPTTNEMTPEDRRRMTRPVRELERAKKSASKNEQQKSDEAPGLLDGLLGGDKEATASRSEKAAEEADEDSEDEHADNAREPDGRMRLEGGRDDAKPERAAAAAPAATAVAMAEPAAPPAQDAPHAAEAPAEEKLKQAFGGEFAANGEQGAMGLTAPNATPPPEPMPSAMGDATLAKVPPDTGVDKAIGDPFAAAPGSGLAGIGAKGGGAAAPVVDAPVDQAEALQAAKDFGMVGFMDVSGQAAGPALVPATTETETSTVTGMAWSSPTDGKNQKEGLRGNYDTAIVVQIGDLGRFGRPCGAGANVPLIQRIGLWRERLVQTGGNPAAVASVYRAAIGSCEAPTWRERSRLLSMLLDATPSVTNRVGLWRILFEDLGAADALYRGILARVRTPEEKRELSAALGLRTIDRTVLEKTIADAKSPVDLVAALRGLVYQWPDDLDLALRLLDAYEDAADRAGARTLADGLRARPDADARVRTAVGELYLRLAASGPEAERAADEAEARRAFGEIVEFAPDDPVARRRLGDLLRAHGWYAEAARHYETLEDLTPDDPTVALLLAAAAQGLGKLEEAVKWTEKGGLAGAPDVSQGPAATARAFAATYLAWGKYKARADGDDALFDRLDARLGRVLSAGRMGSSKDRQARVTLTWSHPELHPTLWSNALGTVMPAPEGDATLGIGQVMLPARGDTFVEVRIEPAELERAARLGAEMVLTVVFDEHQEGEKIVVRSTRFAKDQEGATIRFAVADGQVNP